MKLYATTTSNRASKGQGGDYLSISITVDKNPLAVCIIEVIEKDTDHIEMVITGNGELRSGIKCIIPKKYK